MSEMAGKLDQTGALEQLAQAVTEGKLSSVARQNIEKWLKETRYRKFQAAVIEHIGQAKWKQLDDAFWTVIPFGTGGRRGRMYPIGSNTINDRTIGESAAGLAEYVRQTGSANGECLVPSPTTPGTILASMPSFARESWSQTVFGCIFSTVFAAHRNFPF